MYLIDVEDEWVNRQYRMLYGKEIIIKILSLKNI
jgi:hypothetical protein